MMKQMALAVLAISLAAPQALSQDAAGSTRLAECRLPLRDAMAAAVKYPVNHRETDADSGEVTAVLRAPGLTVIGQPSLGLNIKRATDPVSISFITRVALDYPQMRALLPKAYGKAKCDAEGTAITYCMMNLPDDGSMGGNRVTMSAEPAEGGGTVLTCLYEKRES